MTRLAVAGSERADGASLAVVRVGLGALIAVEAVRYLAFGWVSKYYLTPHMRFPYPGFGWVGTGPPGLLYAVVVVMGLAGLALAVGRLHRLWAVVAGLALGWVFLLDQARYLNHFVLVLILCALCAALPMGAALVRGRDDTAVPVGAIWAVRVQIGLVYVLAAVAKLTPDWLHAWPLLHWLETRADTPVVGALLAWDGTAWAFSYLGVGFDLFVPFLLLSRRARLPALVASAVFHLTNAAVFNIGIFPWLMLLCTTVFFDPAWPRRWMGEGATVSPSGAAGLGLGGGEVRRRRGVSNRSLTFVYAALVVLVFQIGVSLRHISWPGDSSWHEAGHRFAWHMKLRTKRGRVRFWVRDPASGVRTMVDPADHLSARQLRMLPGQPDMLVLFARHLAEHAAADGTLGAQVFAESMVRLNRRPAQPFVDPATDLARVPRPVWGPPDWVLPQAIVAAGPSAGQ